METSLSTSTTNHSVASPTRLINSTMRLENWNEVSPWSQVEWPWKMTSRTLMMAAIKRMKMASARSSWDLNALAEYSTSAPCLKSSFAAGVSFVRRPAETHARVSRSRIVNSWLTKKTHRSQCWVRKIMLMRVGKRKELAKMERKMTNSRKTGWLLTVGQRPTRRTKERGSPKKKWLRRLKSKRMTSLTSSASCAWESNHSTFISKKI